MSITAGWEKIAEVILGAPAQNITIAALDLAADKSYMFIINADGIVAGMNIHVYYNGDFNDLSYWRQRARFDNAATSYLRLNDGRIGWLAANTGSLFEGFIAPDPNGYPRCVCNSSSHSPGSMRLYITGHVRNNVANVTSITFRTGGANGWDTGTTVYLFKVVN